MREKPWVWKLSESLPLLVWQVPSRVLNVARNTSGPEVVGVFIAVGLAGSRRARTSGLVSQDTPIISLACAHPAKFPDAVKSACGIYPGLPDHLANLMQRDDVMLTAENDMEAVQALLRAERR